MAKKGRNKKTLLVALLLLAVVATGAFVGTLARYAASGTVTDEAVVAKFGLNIPNTISLFSETYPNVESDTEGKNVIAPGTSGEYNFEVTGTSEVAYKVTATVTVTYSEEWDGYEPLEFSINGLNWTNLADFKTNLSNALESETMDPGAAYASTQTIYWQWPFHVSNEYDLKDSTVGLAAATETAPSVTVVIEAVAAQIE